jgi:hypothetical protein
MLKITKNQIQKGQQVVVNLSGIKESKDAYSDAAYAKKGFTKAGFKDGDIITIEKIVGTVVSFTNDKGEKFSFYWSWFKPATEIPEDSVNLGESKPEYVVFLDGVKINKKYKDIGKVKTSLLNLMNYYDKLETLVKSHLDKCPELQYMQIPDFLGSCKNLSRTDFGKIEIFTWINRKLGTKVTDFDPLAFYDEAMLLVKVTAQFGSSTRDLFKETKDTHEYILTFMHEDYRNTALRYVSYEDLKESDIIKQAVIDTFGKTVRALGIKKKNKQGKTSLCFKTQSDVIKLMKSLPKDSFFITNMQGDQLVEQSEALIRQEHRDSIIDSILS